MLCAWCRDPVWFDGTWMARIRGDTGDNWRLKASNLKKVYKGILDFYHEVLCQDLTEFPSPDLSGFAERGDRVAMARVLQLILGCAISCQHKHMYIQRIMLLEESVQHVVMATIQELITKEVPTATGDGYADLERQLKSALDELEEVMSTRDEFAQRCHTLDAQVAALQEERSSLLAENQQLLERLNQSESSELTSTPLDRRCSQLQLQVEQLQEEMYRLEATKEELRVKGERQERERVELSLRLEELAERAAETQSLRDELDVLRHTADKANRLEATVDGYRRRLEELGELRRQVRLLEEREAEREKQAQAAGDEVRKAVSARTTADTLRRELLEWQERGAELEVRLQQAEQKLKVEAEQRKTLEKEKERLLKERHLLKELADDLRCSLAQQRTLDPSSSAGSHEHSLDSEADDTLRQKLVRFVEENSMFKARQTDEGDKWTEEEKHADVPDFPELERSMRWRETLESENRELRERVRQLEREIGVMGERILLSESSEDLKEKLEKQLEDVQKTRAHFAEKQKEMELTSACVVELQQKLKEKAEETENMEERYKRYLEKAKSVIRTLDPKTTSLGPGEPATGEYQVLRNKLLEKDKLLELKQRELERTKQQRELEDKLMVTAWYNIGRVSQQQASELRLCPSPATLSFLSWQRQAVRAHKR